MATCGALWCLDSSRIWSLFRQIVIYRRVHGPYFRVFFLEINSLVYVWARHSLGRDVSFVQHSAPANNGTRKYQQLLLLGGLQPPRALTDGINSIRCENVLTFHYCCLFVIRAHYTLKKAEHILSRSLFTHN